jgi:hypothetical protein
LSEVSVHVGETAILVLLQNHAAATGHFRQFAYWKNDHLAILADDGDVVALDGRAGLRLDALGQVEHLFATAGLRHDLFLRHDEAAAVI